MLEVALLFAEVSLCVLYVVRTVCVHQGVVFTLHGECRACLWCWLAFPFQRVIPVFHDFGIDLLLRAVLRARACDGRYWGVGGALCDGADLDRSKTEVEINFFLLFCHNSFSLLIVKK